METSSYSAQQRRAINLVWTASGDYQFEPQFLALKSNGEPDFYMNCVIGLVHKWFGDKMPKRLFAYWAGDARQNVFDELCWLALENAAYEKELPERPVLADLRRTHAEEFFASEYQLSRQEWMEKNQLVYAVQSDRWKTILGQKPPILAPWEKGLAQALACPGTMNAAELEIAVRAAFEKYLQFDGTVHKKGGFQLHFDDKWAPLLTKLLPTEIVRTDDLTIGRSAMPGENGMVKVSNALRSRLRSNEHETEDRGYIERCFGRSIYSPDKLARIEQQLCTGNHLGCHLWFTKGASASDQLISADTQRLYEQAEDQAKLNRAAFARDLDLHQSALAHLSEQIRNCLLVHQQPEHVPARQGWLDGTKVWREPVLHDDRVFLRSDEESRPGFAVDLMLDASASRLHCQESIAIQGYLLAKSLVSCGIPVRVTGFCSLRGYTVLRVLKDFGDKNGEHRVFDYFAAGWNRDGLALRGMGELMKSAPADKHLLILLTDASPNDSHKILPSGKIPLSRDYDGQPGIDDTAATMHDELADLGGRLMVEVLRQYAGGDPSTPIPQEEALATYAAKLTKADGHIDWDEDAAVIHARIRGVTPWPGAQTVFLLPGRDPLPALLQPGRVGETFTGGHPAPGTLVALRDGKLLIACRDALYEVSTLKPAGGKPMSAEAFWNGYCRAANKDGCGRAVSPSLG